MNKNQLQTRLNKARNAQGEDISNRNQGITERLLRKYKPSKVISLTKGRYVDLKNDIAA